MHVCARLGFTLMAIALGGLLQAADYVTREEALAAAFPGASIRSETLFLTQIQQREAAALSGVEIHTSLIARYTALKDGTILGRAYVDTHVVHTKKESLLIILDAAGTLLRIETTASGEGPEHQAPRAWYRQYEGRQLNDDLYIDRGIRPIAGATLTARATNQAARRVLAIDKVVSGRPEGTR
jgi:hypothetical protein